MRRSASDDNALRAFDKTVRRKPLAFAADAVYGNSIDLELWISLEAKEFRSELAPAGFPG